jgi:hypothetical protein
VPADTATTLIDNEVAASSDTPDPDPGNNASLDDDAPSTVGQSDRRQDGPRFGHPWRDDHVDGDRQQRRTSVARAIVLDDPIPTGRPRAVCVDWRARRDLHDRSVVRPRRRPTGDGTITITITATVSADLHGGDADQHGDLHGHFDRSERRRQTRPQ